MNSGEMFDQIIKGTVHQLWLSLPLWWMAFRWYIIAFVVIVIGCMAWQMILFRSGSKKGLSSDFNKMIGSLFFGIFFLLQLGVSYWIWGPQVIDDIWFAIFSATSFAFTGIFLRAIGVWRY